METGVLTGRWPINVYSNFARLAEWDRQPEVIARVTRHVRGFIIGHDGKSRVIDQVRGPIMHNPKKGF